MHRALTIAITCLSLLTSAMAVREILQIETPQPAQQVEGVVLDPSGAPISDLTVADCTANWAAVLRSTKTDSKGHFHFSRQSGKKLYYLRFDHPMFNPLELKLKLDKKAAKGITAKPEIGG